MWIGASISLYNVLVVLYDKLRNTYWVYINFFYLFMLILFVPIIKVFFKHTFKEAGLYKAKQSFRNENYLIPAIIFAFLIIIMYAGQAISGFKFDYIIVLIFVINQFFLVAVCEELIFRGYITNKLFNFAKNTKSYILIIFISAVLFSLMHLPFFLLNGAVEMGIIQRIIIPLLLGFWFAVYYSYTKNLVICIFVHGAYNLIADFTFDWFQYVCYGIFWLAMIVYLIFIIRKCKTYYWLKI
jgi:membrane protease YdiL (CAAX protease family)